MTNPMVNRNTLAAGEMDLPDVRGRISYNVPLADSVWFQVGGLADVLFSPADVDDLAAFISELDGAVPVMTIGAGSNLLVRDGGIRGVVISLDSAFQEIEIDGTRVAAGGGALDVKVANASAHAELTGLEFLRGIPGTIGGAVAMNAGAYGGQVSDVLESAVLVTGNGTTETRPAGDLELGYRHSNVSPSEVVVSATFALAKGDVLAIRRRMNEIAEVRAETQPVNTRTGGSTFRNPPGEGSARAWELIEQAGCRGLTMGLAQVSEKHCNFIINTGGATADDIESLGEEVRRRVNETAGVMLEWEIHRVGEPLAND